MFQCSECGREIYEGSECPVHGESVVKLFRKLKLAGILALIIIGIVAMCAVEGKAQDLAKPGIVEGQTTPPTRKFPVQLSMEERMSLMEASQIALQADNALQRAVSAYYEAQQKAKDAVAVYQGKVADASKKAACVLDAKFICVPDEKKVAANK